MFGMRSPGPSDVGIQDAFIHDELLLGEPAKPGTCCCRRSTTSATSCRVVVRSSTACSRRAQHVGEREALGRKIGQFQILQHYIGDIAMWRHQADLVVRHAAWLQDQGRDCSPETSIAKVTASEAAVAAAGVGIQILAAALATPRKPTCSGISATLGYSGSGRSPTRLPGTRSPRTSDWHAPSSPRTGTPLHVAGQTQRGHTRWRSVLVP